MSQLRKISLALIYILQFSKIQAQGGGPPMLTDDPGTRDVGHWEINTSVNSQLTKNSSKVAIPYVDANYGATSRVQLKIEAPFLITFGSQQHSFSKFGDPLLGVKYRFMDEDKHFISVSVYPQFFC